MFDNPFEFHMGAYSWKLKVFNERLKKQFSKSGLICPYLYQPWSNDSSCLFLASWKKGAFLYEIAYDEAKYGCLNRDSFALILSGSTQCVASLLDEWNEIELHANSDVLRMMVYRPVGEIFERRGQPVCKVDEHWVESRLRP